MPNVSPPVTNRNSTKKPRKNNSSLGRIPNSPIVGLPLVPHAPITGPPLVPRAPISGPPLVPHGRIPQSKISQPKGKKDNKDFFEGIFGGVKKGINETTKQVKGFKLPGDPGFNGPPPVVSSNVSAAQRINNRKNKGGERFVAGKTGKNAGQHEFSGDKVGTGKIGKHPLLHRAKETIAAQMNPQLAEYGQEIADTTSSSQQQQADLTDLYRRLGIQLDSNKSQGDISNASALKSITDKYNTLGTGINATYDKAASDTNSELSRLGIQEVSPAATAQTGLDHNYLNSLTAIDKTNAEANSTAKTQGFDNLLGTLQGQAGLAGAQDKSKVLRQAAQAVADLRSKRGALAATRRGAVDALYHQLKDAQTQRQVDMAQQNFMNQIAAGKLGIEQGQLGINQGKLNLDAQNSVVGRDLKRAQAAKDMLYIKNGGTLTKNTIKGFNAGLGLLQNMQTGNDVAAKDLQKTALQIYQNVFANYGPDAYRTLTTAGQGTNKPLSELASGFASLPRAGKNAVLDALKAASK